jgi:hypothetical protein
MSITGGIDIVYGNRSRFDAGEVWCGSCDQTMDVHTGTYADPVCPDVCAGCGEIIGATDGPVYRDDIQVSVGGTRWAETFHDPKSYDCYPDECERRGVTP